jgi:uncharacterized protein YvpB
VGNNPVNFNDPTGHKPCDEEKGCGGPLPKRKQNPIQNPDDDHYHGRHDKDDKTQPASYIHKNSTLDELLESAQLQGNKTGCGPYSIAMAANLYNNPGACTANGLQGNKVQNHLQWTMQKSPLLGMPTQGGGLWATYYASALQSYVPDAVVTQYENSTIFDLKNAIVRDAIVVVAVSWQTDEQIISDPLNATVGHYMVAVGFDKNNIHFLDSYVGGVTTYSNETFNYRWNETSNSFIAPGTMFTISP